ncbi:fatty acid hydroxylase family protein [Roseococcus sp. SYP-B2431]|uniref:sterol desaturase family protein n=1 Tax=Roseococcus sp. SYP-B2431 TaxID=2496640 RepID=UPI00103DD67B|nr:sterol desaturase family protein [Roseococcus sp. SYP-B2431]TCH99810.1 fatty acid hydroxylase family protein [Roseococcus sp. SYP-B2431]
MTDFLQDQYDGVTSWLFEVLLQPAMYALGLMNWADEAFQWMDFFVFGVIQVIVVAAVCLPLERWRPVERWESHGLVWTDVLYTLLSRLGILPLLGFILFYTASSRIEGMIADSGFVPPTLETLLPWLREAPLVALALYIVILDFTEYWRHRFQHIFPWWWALHSIHHAQTQMTFWTDDRNHILDDIIAAAWFGIIAVAIGVPPGQFPIILLVLRLAESLSHANVRLDFGRLGERLLVSPRFHRLHHGVLSVGNLGKNYGVLLPVWDWIFGTADFRRDHYPRTGDPDAPATYVRGGWLAQQAAGLRQVWRAITARGA